MAEKVEKYLAQLGKQEREIRVVLSNPASTVAQRTSALKLLNDILIFMRGFFVHSGLTDGAKKSEYYKEYYEQARSARGLKA